MNPLGLLAEVIVKPVPELLAELAEFYANSDDPENPRVPKVTLHLSSGRDLSGRIVKLGQDPTFGQTLLVHILGEEERNPEITALFIPVTAITAVTVHRADQFGDLLSEGVLPGPTTNAPPPSRLEIARLADELAKTLAKARGITLKPDLGDGADLDSDALRSLSVLVRETFAVLTDIAADKLGKEALSSVKSIKFSDSGSAEVKLSNNRLEVFAAFGQGRAGRLSKAELKSRLSSVL